MELEKVAEKARNLNNKAVTTRLSKNQFKVNVPYPFLSLFSRIPILINNTFGRQFNIEVKDENTLILIEKSGT